MAEGTVPQTPADVALNAALVRAQAAVRGIEKDATNKFHKYNYVSSEAMIRFAKEILSNEGLAIIPTASLLDAPIVPIADPDAGWMKVSRSAATLRTSWLVIHKDGGSLCVESTWPVAPENGRPIDKAVAAARTASLSYLLRDLLQIPRVEEGTDLDDNSRDKSHTVYDPTDKQREEIRARLSMLKVEEGQRAYLASVVKTFAHEERLPETADEADKVIAVLDRRIAERMKSGAPA